MLIGAQPLRRYVMQSAHAWNACTLSVKSPFANNPARFGGHHQGKDMDFEKLLIAGFLIGFVSGATTVVLFIWAMMEPIL